MKHLKIFEEFKVGTYYTSSQEDSSTHTEEISGYPVKIIDRNSGEKAVFAISLILASGSVMLQDLCFSELNDAKKHIADIITKFEKSDLKIESFIIKKMILDLVVDVESEEDGETPPKWVKNPKSWAMDKIVELLTPENINQIVNTYINSGIFKSKESDIKSNIKAIYQSSKDKRELDVTDHIRLLGIKSIKGVHYLKGDKNEIAKKFENLLRYFQK